jgi:hypothetical protein
MPYPYSPNPTEATAAKGTAHMKATAHNESAAVAASQLSLHFGGKASVKAVGSTVLVSSTNGIKEQDWVGATLTLPTTTAAPKVARVDISVKNTDGDWDALEDSAPAATSALNKEFRETGKKAQASAVATGANAYSVPLPAMRVVDGVTFALGEPSAGKQKKATSATLLFGPPVSEGVGDNPYVPVIPIGIP